MCFVGSKRIRSAGLIGTDSGRWMKLKGFQKIPGLSKGHQGARGEGDPEVEIAWD